MERKTRITGRSALTLAEKGYAVLRIMDNAVSREHEISIAEGLMHCKGGDSALIYVEMPGIRLDSMEDVYKHVLEVLGEGALCGSAIRVANFLYDNDAVVIGGGGWHVLHLDQEWLMRALARALSNGEDDPAGERRAAAYFESIKAKRQNKHTQENWGFEVYCDPDEPGHLERLLDEYGDG